MTDQTDIVGELREFYFQTASHEAAVYPEVTQKAADEIERLRSDRDILLANLDEMFDAHGNYSLEPEGITLIEQIRRRAKELRHE